LFRKFALLLNNLCRKTLIAVLKLTCSSGFEIDAAEAVVGQREPSLPAADNLSESQRHRVVEVN